MDIEQVNDYYDAVTLSLDAIGSVISANEGEYVIDNSKLSGRDGSSYFEDVLLKPLLRKYSDVVADEANKALQGNMFRFVSVSAPESNSEAQKRSLADISIFLEHPDGIIREELINVKATNGNSADNVGSWASLNHVLYGDVGKLETKRTSVIEKLGSVELPDNLNDYFLWVFKKNVSSVEDLFARSSVHSMLATNFDAFKVNMSQNYPLQFNSSKAVRVVFSDDVVFTDVKRDFVVEILRRGSQFYEAQVDLWGGAVESLLGKQAGAIE